MRAVVVDTVSGCVEEGAVWGCVLAELSVCDVASGVVETAVGDV